MYVMLLLTVVPQVLNLKKNVKVHGYQLLSNYTAVWSSQKIQVLFDKNQQNGVWVLAAYVPLLL